MKRLVAICLVVVAEYCLTSLFGANGHLIDILNC